jgi:DNA repair protein RadD
VIPQLRPYQLDLVDRMRSLFASGKRIVVCQSSTGSGKTNVASHIAKIAKGRVLFLVHRRKLVNQISERLEEFQVNHGVIMRGETQYSAAAVQVASRDTLLSRCFRNEWQGLPQADLVIVDEAHHAADPDSEYRRILSNYPKAKIVLLSATPVGPDGKGLGPWAEGIACAIGTKELIESGFLVPVKCYAPDRKMMKGRAKKGIAGDLVESWKSYGEGMPTVLFCSRVQHSLDAVEAYKQAGIPFAHIDANTDEYTREKAFEHLASGKLQGVSNVGIIGEGVDVPELGCCQIYCECTGRVGFIQRCGRVMRPSPGKKYGVLIDHAGAVFKHGFPDENTEWTLEGNTDESFRKKKEAGLTSDVHFCSACELLFSGAGGCPQCGKLPSKPPRSIFAAPEMDSRNELLTEVDRSIQHEFSREQQITHWKICLAVAAKKNGTFGMASQIFKRKYGKFPDSTFPDMPPRNGWKFRVTDVKPGYGKKKPA